MRQWDRIYLDYNATAPIIDEARRAMIDSLGGPTNASSVHSEGRIARKIVETARKSVASAVNADSGAVTFTSGATEANVMALSPVVSDGARQHRLSRVFVSSAAHPSVVQGGRFATGSVVSIPVDRNGLLDETWLDQRLAELEASGERAMIAVALANNETGVVQPLDRLVARVKVPGHFLHVDAVQAPGRLRVDVRGMDADSFALSGHKIGGPQGVGALVCRSGNYRPAPLLTGGGQEARLRAGTENVAAIAGFGAAFDTFSVVAEQEIRIFPDRDFLEREMRTMFRTITIFGEHVLRIGNTCCFAIPEVAADTLMIALDLEGISVSSGSACSSGKVGTSHVLEAMGVNKDLARGAIRISLGDRTTRGEIERFLEVLQRAVSRISRK